MRDSAKVLNCQHHARRLLEKPIILSETIAAAQRDQIWVTSCWSVEKPVSKRDIAKTGFHPIPAGEEWRVEVINELVRIRDGSMTLIGWNLDEIQEMLHNIVKLSVTSVILNHLFGLKNISK